MDILTHLEPFWLKACMLPVISLDRWVFDQQNIWTDKFLIKSVGESPESSQPVKSWEAPPHLVVFLYVPGSVVSP